MINKNVVLVVFFFFGVSALAQMPSLLIVGADPGEIPVLELNALGEFSVVAEFDSSAGTPTLALLEGYDVVLAYTDWTPANAVGLGDVLADYVDGGGRLVVSTYGFSNTWAIAGRIMTAGYSPLMNVGVNGNVSGNLNALVPTHPIFNGIDLATVVYFFNSNFAHPNLDPGATVLADDGAGILMIAENANRDVIGFNMFPGQGVGNNAEFYEFLGNTLVYAAGIQQIPTLSEWGLLVFVAALGTLALLKMRRI